jgi:hypothetical protein
MTKLQHAQKHIVLREQWFEVKFNLFRRAYAHLHMMFVRKESIVGANNTLESYIQQYRTAQQLRQHIEQL